MSQPVAYSADAIVVGSGPGGATVARGLARAGRRVLILERGLDHRRAPYYGTHLGGALYTDRGSFLFTEEGVNIVRPLMVGGATGMFCGCAAPPPPWLAGRYGIDISSEVEETMAELEIAPLPRELLGSASTRIAEAASAVGLDWEPLPKFMKPGRLRPFDCGAKCMLGCRCSAKWHAGEWVDDAVESGARLITRARVDRIVAEDGHIAGARGRIGRKPFAARAETVVLAAGGMGTPRILQASGFGEAGDRLAIDTTAVVYGLTDEKGNAGDPPMTWGWEDEGAGIMMSTLIDPWLNYPLVLARTDWRFPLNWPKWGRTLGVMIKLRDDLTGGMPLGGRIRKPMTPGDRERMSRGRELARRILVEAGADPDSIFPAPLRGTHPSATVRVGHLLDENLRTEIEGLYVCDASALPEALGRPTVLTLIGLGKRLTSIIVGSSAKTQGDDGAGRA